MAADMKTYDAANDGLPYPQTFQEFMGVVARWARARHITPNLAAGQSHMDCFVSSIDELNDAVAVFRQVWANAEAARNAGVPADDRAQQCETMCSRFGNGEQCPDCPRLEPDSGVDVPRGGRDAG